MTGDEDMDKSCEDWDAMTARVRELEAQIAAANALLSAKTKVVEAKERAGLAAAQRDEWKAMADVHERNHKGALELLAAEREAVAALAKIIWFKVLCGYDRGWVDAQIATVRDRVARDAIEKARAEFEKTMSATIEAPS